MNHYSDIGFKIKNTKDSTALRTKMLLDPNNKPNVYNALKENTYLYWRQVGRYIFATRFGFDPKDVENSVRGEFFVAYHGKATSRVKLLEMYDENSKFPIIKFEAINNLVPFWFACFNADMKPFKIEQGTNKILEQEQDTNVILLSYADDYVVIKDPDIPEVSAEDIAKAREFNSKPLAPKEVWEKFVKQVKEKGLIIADESYFSHLKDFDLSFAQISGFIDNVELVKNPMTGKKFYDLTVGCLGLNINMLIDPKFLRGVKPKVGKVISGRFWNSMILTFKKTPKAKKKVLKNWKKLERR